MILPLSLNPLQAAVSIMQPRDNYLVWGRASGKSSYFGAKQHEIITHLPGSSTIIAAYTYTHVLTSILPAAFAHLERMGYLRDIHYVIGKQPPAKWGLPYNAPVKDFSNYITFFSPERAVGFMLTSQERLGSGRGPNMDFLMTDETLRLNKQRIDNELYPTLRANKDKFKHVPWHLGQYNSTSMPITQSGRWILDIGNYYLEEHGVDYFGLWRQVVKMQLELLDIEDPIEFTTQWNEIQRVRRQMKPKLSKDEKTLFTFGNAFDNIQNVGLSYIKDQRRNLPDIIFLIEIMNMVLVMNDNCFYSINEDRHIYYDGYDDDLTNNLAISSNFDFEKLSSKRCEILSRRYYNPKEPIYLFFDWGGNVSFVLSAQFDKLKNTLFILKEFYVMPGDEMAKRLMEEVAQFYHGHDNKTVYFVRDTYGDNKNIQSSRTVNETAIKQLQRNKWKVIPKKHRYKEPPMYEKWQLMQHIMGEGDDKYFKLRIDGNNCKYLVIAMKDTKVKTIGNELKKDKSLERKESADQRTAPHSTDALDKGCYYLNRERKTSLFVEGNI